MRVIKFIIFLVIFLGFFKSRAVAQSNINLSVTPPISYLHVSPGTTRDHTVILENTGDETITVLPSIVDFTSDGKTGRAVISNQLSFPYISFGASDIKELSVPAHKKAQLTLHIDVPSDAEEKEYPITVLFFSKRSAGFSELNPLQLTSSYSQVSGAIGSNLVVLVSKNPTLEQAIKIIDLKSKTFVDSFGKIEFIPLIKNDSLSSSTATGSAKILNWRKEVVAEFEIYPDVILGLNSREIRALRSGESSDKPETGSFAFKPKFLLGPYQIVVNVDENQLQKNNYIKVVYALPFSLIFVFILGIIVMLFYSKKIKKQSI
ncbi:hypothetical protein KA111_02575 [Candidatus Woesebacteria bacterium]|nr:hypothetical protein [Candidatus Woesebacteria bacterium]